MKISLIAMHGGYPRPHIFVDVWWEEWMTVCWSAVGLLPKGKPPLKFSHCSADSVDKRDWCFFPQCEVEYERWIDFSRQSQPIRSRLKKLLDIAAQLTVFAEQSCIGRFDQRAVGLSDAAKYFPEFRDDRGNDFIEQLPVRN